MNMRRFIVEMGTGVDQHGQDVTKAATLAVKDAVSRVCLSGLMEIVRLKNINDMVVDVLVACPNPRNVKKREVLKVLPFGKKRIQVVAGGMSAKVSFEPELGDQTDYAVMANAAITVSVDMDSVLETWKKGA